MYITRRPAGEEKTCKILVFMLDLYQYSIQSYNCSYTVFCFLILHPLSATHLSWTIRDYHVYQLSDLHSLFILKLLFFGVFF